MILKADSPFVDKLAPSCNFGQRRGAGANGVTMLVMHYTGMKSCARAIKWLADPKSDVSCQYVIDVDGTITQMVAESARAWHAGRGCWAGERDINSVSIGIEIHNPGHELGYPEFPDAQMSAVEKLSRDILQRHAIPAHRVLAHSDVAPQRKGDPGEKFDWARLAAAGIGFWVEAAPIDEADETNGSQEHARMAADARQLLAQIGYDIAAEGKNFHGPEDDPRLHKTVLAFQRHFRPQKCDGRIDESTLATLKKIVAKLGPVAIS